MTSTIPSNSDYKKVDLDFEPTCIDVHINCLPEKYLDKPIFSANSLSEINYDEYDKDKVECIKRCMQNHLEVDAKRIEDMLGAYQEMMFYINGKTVRELKNDENLYLCGHHEPFMRLFGETSIDNGLINFSIGYSEEKGYYLPLQHMMPTVEKTNRELISPFKIPNISELDTRDVLNITSNTSYSTYVKIVQLVSAIGGINGK